MYRAFFITLSFTLSIGYSSAQSNKHQTLIDSLIEQIASEQITIKKDFYPGMFYSYRGIAAPPYNYQPDNNIFFSAIGAFTLKNMKPALTNANQKALDTIINKVVATYPYFKHKNGLPYYNFWPTGAPIMPNSLFFEYLTNIFLQGEDADDSAMVLMSSDADDSTSAVLKNRMNAISNLSTPKRNIKSTFKRYRKYPAFTTYLGTKMPVDFDFAVQCNLLYFTYDRDLPFSANDKGTLDLITKMVEERLYMKRPVYISPYYVKPSILLYHLTRLMAAFKPSSLEPFKPQLINDLKLLQSKSNNTMEQILISTSLLRLGAESPALKITSIADFEISDQKKFVFFQARPAFWYRSPLKQIFLHLPYLNSQFYSPTYNKVLWLENLALRD
ncbi:MAG: hypothetical protein RLZ16_793 [Bacteroidota bacterium]